jgi:hypothetical protein
MMNRLVATAVTTVIILSSVHIHAVSAETETIIRINAGSEDDFIDKKGDVWVADTANLRPLDAPPSMTWKTGAAIANSRRDDSLYQTERFGSGVNLKYSIPVPGAGRYLVRLYFSENYFQARNERKFHVTIQGKVAIANVDIFKAARNQRHRAMSKAVEAEVSGDKLDIEFIKVKQNVSQVDPSCPIILPIHAVSLLMISLANSTG